MINERLGPYRIVRELGRGGMGSVWVGEHGELGHQVAIKVLLSREDDSVQRFFNEARAAAKLTHPGIVRVFDFGRGDGGAPYIAMELLDGVTLRARGRMTCDEAATIARQVATTLAAAHEAGIVHRDLKPDNIMLVRDPETATGERPKVLDFGIAKLAEDRWTASVSTQTGSLLGTPHYMSPEQCAGARAIDARTDIYALGCILFELVCGRPPHVGEGMGEIVGKHQFVAPPSPTSLRADCPAWLEAVILRALAKDPADRFQSMQEMADALEAAGVPAARTGKVAPNDSSVALAETVRTPGDARVVTALQVEHATDQDVATMTAEAQRRAQEIAASIAKDPKVARGKGMTVIAVAVVVLASIALFVHFGTRPAEDTAPRAVAAGSGAGNPRPKGGSASASSVANIPVGSGSGGGSGTGIGPIASVDAVLESAQAAFQLGQWAAARELALQATTIDPDDSDGWSMAAITSCHLGDADHAKRYLAHLAAGDQRNDAIAQCHKVGVSF